MCQPIVYENDITYQPLVLVPDASEKFLPCFAVGRMLKF